MSDRAALAAPEWGACGFDEWHEPHEYVIADGDQPVTLPCPGVPGVVAAAYLRAHALTAPMTDDRAALGMTSEEVVGRVLAEYERANSLHGPIHSGHEGWAVIQEEVDELWDAVKANDLAHACVEAIQVAAMAVRFVTDISGLPDDH